jgi:branched-chain amino acid transport system permease protein
MMGGVAALGGLAPPALLPLAGLTGLPAFLVNVATFAVVYVVLALGLNLQWGYTGLFNISVAAFWGVGAYTAAIVTKPPSAPTAFGLNLPYLWVDVAGVPLPLAPAVLAGALVAGALGLLVAIPTLRLRDDYLAIATLGLAEVIRLVLTNEEWLTQGARGLSVSNPLLAADYSNVLLLGVALVLLGVTYWLLETGVDSPWGRVLKAIREDEAVAESVGKDAFTRKTQSFVLGSAVMGAAGTVTALQLNFLVPSQFGPRWAFYVYIAVIVGGSGTNRGAVLGGVLLAALLELPRFLRDFVPFESVVTNLRLFVIGLLVVLVMTYRPWGILGDPEAIRREE